MSRDEYLEYKYNELYERRLNRRLEENEDKLLDDEQRARDIIEEMKR